MVRRHPPDLLDLTLEVDDMACHLAVSTLRAHSIGLAVELLDKKVQLAATGRALDEDAPQLRDM